MIKIKHTCRCKAPRQFAYDEYLGIGNYYTKLSNDHISYEIVGDIIKINEKSWFQNVEHNYKIIEKINGSKMRLVSKDSQVTLFGLIRAKSMSITSFEFVDSDVSAKSKVKLMIEIHFPNKFRELLARLFLTPQIWNTHAKDELLHLCRHIETKFRVQ
ncbi:MAG: hypothetical protein PSN36_01150 [Gammaproteobacteria bacterium]|nr:hypothetical protein [Gammaproteobacteria bacterium]